MKQEYRNRFKILKGGKISLIVSALCMHVAVAAPQGGNVVSGSANINQNGDVTNIHQSSQKASINWNSFNVSKQETVNFNQPNKNAITLNRVVGNERSVINGALNANGQVWILNSNGVLFGKNARVNTAGLLATTREISDQDFQAGNYKFVGDSDESVINLGEIEIKDGGYAALLGKSVSNEGTIKAIKGRIELVGAQEYLINLNGNSLVNVKVEKSVVDALVANKGLIKADGGKVYLTTSSAQELIKGVVNNSGVIEAYSIDDITSEVILFAHGGRAEIAGRIEAREGFVETSGKEFSIEDESVIRAGYWLIDPVNITIDDNLAGIVETALSSGDVQITTDGSNTPDTSSGEENGEGNIFVNASVSWSSGSKFTLYADNDIYINQDLTSSGFGSIELGASNDIVTNASMIVNNGEKIKLDAHNNIYLKGNIVSNNGGLVELGVGHNLYINSEMFINDGGKLKIAYAQLPNYEGNYYINAPVYLDDGENFSTIRDSSSQIDYTVISSKDDLQSMQSNVNYALGKDITFDGIEEFTPIDEFQAYFDGLGHTIDKLVINDSGTMNVGLFRDLGATIYHPSGLGYVYNLGLTNVDIDVTGDSATSVGGIAGKIERGLVKNSYVTGNISGGEFLGGLAGNLDSQSAIVKSHSNVVLSSSNGYVGGLVGQLSNGSQVVESYVNGNIDQGLLAGGLAAIVDDSSIIGNSYVNGNILTNDYSGGLVGQLSGRIENSYFSGTVYANSSGAIVSSAQSTASLKDTFFLQESGGVNDSIAGISENSSSQTDINDHATAKTSEELESFHTFLSAYWDIQEDENIDASQSYPVLSNDGGSVWKIRKVATVPETPTTPEGPVTPESPETPESPVTPEVVASETNSTTNTIQRVVTAIINKKAVNQPDVSVLKIPKLQVSVNNLKVETPSYNAPTNIGETTVNRVKIVSSPQAEETTTSVTQTQVQTMQNSESTVVPVDKDSLVSIVDSGVNLPEGMEQVFFVVPEENE